MPGKQWEGMTIKETLEEFQVDSERGLTENEARRRLELVGLNQLKEQKENISNRSFCVAIYRFYGACFAWSYHCFRYVR